MSSDARRAQGPKKEPGKHNDAPICPIVMWRPEKPDLSDNSDGALPPRQGLTAGGWQAGTSGLTLLRTVRVNTTTTDAVQANIVAAGYGM